MGVQRPALAHMYGVCWAIW